MVIARRAPLVALALALALVLALAATACGPRGKGPEAPRARTGPGVGLTIYSAPGSGGGYNEYAYDDGYGQANGFAIVKERREVTLDGASPTLRFTDVAKMIDATTVHFKSLTDPSGTQVLEQNYEYDLVSAEKILEKHLERSITLVLDGGREITGKLLAFDGAQVVLETGDAVAPIEILGRGDVRNIKFGALPGGMITKPTLVWLLGTQQPGKHLVQVTYETAGMSWNADYTAIIAANDAAVDLSGWVTIHNGSGGSYPDADLKLVAGDVNRAPRIVEHWAARGRGSGAKSALEQEETGFVEKAFFEYHMYTLGRRTTLPDQSIKQLELFDPATNVPAKKIYTYFGGLDWQWGGGPYLDRDYGSQGNRKVEVLLEVENKKQAGMGMPLPAGRVRVYKKDDADGSLEMIGEDAIDHTPRDEKLKLKLGNAFDVVGERKQTDFKADYDAKKIQETFEIRVRNHKDVKIQVVVREVMYRWVNWSIAPYSHAPVKIDARTVHFPVEVPANGETVVSYTVTYTW